MTNGKCAAGHCAGPALFPASPSLLPFREPTPQKPAVTVMVKAARLAGNVLLRNINKLEALNVVQKGRMDYASEVDADAEKVIVKELKRAYPDYGIFGEEGGVQGERRQMWSSTRWTAPAITCAACRTTACRSLWSRMANRPMRSSSTRCAMNCSPQAVALAPC